MLAEERRVDLEKLKLCRHGRLTYHVTLGRESCRGHKSCCADESTYCCEQGTTIDKGVVSEKSIRKKWRCNQSFHLRIEAIC